MKRLLVVLLLFLGFSVANAQDSNVASFTLPDGSFSFDYPDTWTADYQGFAVVLSNNPSLLEVNSGRLAAGDLLIRIYGMSDLNALGLETLGDPTEALTLVSERLSNQLSFTPVETLQLGDKVVAQAKFTNESVEGAYLAWDVNGRILTIIALSSGSQYADFEPDILNLVETSVYDASAVDLANSRVSQFASIGPENAPNVIYEYGTFGCHACRAVHQAGVLDGMFDYIEANGENSQVRFVFVNFPVISPFNDPMSAEVGHCVLDLGRDAYWQYHDALFELSDSQYGQIQTPDGFIAVAGNLGLDTGYLQTCMAERTHRGAVLYGLNASQQAEVVGTPTFFINDQQVGPSDVATFVDALSG